MSCRLLFVFAGCAALVGTGAFAAEMPAGILRAAKERMHGKAWKVEGLVQGEKGFKVSGLIDGSDFDLTVQTARGSSRQIALNEQGWLSADGGKIVIKDSSWVSYDRGKTWKKVSADDRPMYGWVQSPIVWKGVLPDFEAVGREPREDESWLHLRLKVTEKLNSERERPHYWLALDADGQPLAVRRYEGNLLQSEQVLFCEIDYRQARKDAAIKTPTASAAAARGLPPPIDETLGFFDIERQKFELAGKVVRVEITGRTLAADPLGGNIVRVMVQDNAEHYGLVEFPRAGLEKLGISAKYSGKPVTLYLLITPQGKKAAAKATAVGSKFTGGSYEW